MFFVFVALSRASQKGLQVYECIRFQLQKTCKILATSDEKASKKQSESNVGLVRITFRYYHHEFVISRYVVPPPLIFLLPVFNDPI